MTNSLPRAIALSLLITAASVTPDLVKAAEGARIAGTASYRERVALTPNAVFEATLEDVSRADARATVIARVRRRNPGQVPIRFELRYDRRRLGSTRRYVVRAVIREDGRLRFTGTHGILIRASGKVPRVAILMHRAADTQAGLANTRWRAIRIGSQTVTVTGQQREPWIVLDPRSMRVTGSGGCNRISGSYAAGRDTLRFGRIISTMMACPGVPYESAFLRALGDTRRYRVQGRTLDLLDGRGRMLARLEERNL